ncbi:uncharacterized protein LOC111006459 isoform X2 [Momordica charantia]|uniref:Uncharacterized protein LOC111006459 isoform X2 n=1 Tax=Momordica charantia TaxID=3673 RepID=A0A6J1BX52_MOMCH|nr:uncharacterized protein LOC111006459 isoform X2 [Momordica charantia]
MGIPKSEMGFQNEEKSVRILRALKTLFFLITMFISLLFFSAPILIAMVDSLLPSALLYPDSLSFKSLSSNLQNYNFASSIVDIPLISISRSAIIVCILCDGAKLSRGPYLAAVMGCSSISLVFVSVKAYCLFGGSAPAPAVEPGGATEMVLLFGCSLILALGHFAVAYRTSCRERRKLRVYQIDIEAVFSGSQKGFPQYKKILLEGKAVE